MADVKGKATEVCKETIESLGYELVEVSYKKEYGTPTLTFFIDVDRDGGINLDDCEKVSKAIDALLDEADVTQGVAYNLNVSSPGIDRPLKTERDFVKNKDKKIELNFYAPQDGKKKIEGVLIGWNEQTVTIQAGKKELTYDRKIISIIKPIF